MRRSDDKMLKTRRRKSWLREQPRSKSVGYGVPADLRREEHGGVGGIVRNGELEEAKLANAGIGMDGPSRFALGRSV
jgi:hypothetical protein